MKKFISFLLVMITITMSGQDIQSAINSASAKNSAKELSKMSDKELLSYWTQAQQQGYTLNQLKTLARAQGATESDISQFEKRIKGLKAFSEEKEDSRKKVENDLTSIFGITGPDQKTESDDSLAFSLPIFGMKFFEVDDSSSIDNFSSSPQLNIATPSSYQLGPGDEVTINVWGASENVYTSKIDTRGYIKIDRIAPVYLSGYTIAGAKKRVGNALSKIYSGINSSKESYQKVFFDISLSGSRSIVLNIVGSVKRPGTYTLSSMVSLLNALYAAGGPTETGSFRNIQVVRNGKIFKTVDLYDYFVKGIAPIFSLRDQDVILIPAYENRAFVNGEFKETGIFEFKNNETLEDMLSFTGGVSSFGYKNKIFIESISGINKKISAIDSGNFNSTELSDGDIIRANPVADKYTNKVSIEGAIYLPGNYSIEGSPNLKSLIANAQGLKDDALLSRALIYRFREGKEKEILSVNLSNILSGKEKLEFEANDRVQIFSKSIIEDEAFVEIRGEVNITDDDDDGKFAFFEGMRVSDLILLSGGVKEGGDLFSINVFRQTFDKSGKVPFRSISAKLNVDYTSSSLEENPVLAPGDLVVVRVKEGVVEPEYVEITGLVKSPGVYSLLNNKYSLYDLLNDSGGILEDGAISGVKIKRINTAKEEIEEVVGDLAKDSLGFEIEEQKDYIEFGVDVAELYKTKGADPKYNVVLKGGDIVEVPKVDNTIEIIGEVEQPTVVNYKKGMGVMEAIGQAGGLTDLAKKRGVFVIYQNGNIASNKKYFIFNNMPRLQPGCKIIVPKKIANPNKTSLAEIIGLTSTLATLAVLINSL